MIQQRLGAAEGCPDAAEESHPWHETEVYLCKSVTLLRNRAHKKNNRRHIRDISRVIVGMQHSVAKEGFLEMPLNPDYSVSELSEYAKRRGCRRILVRQIPDNVADLIKSRTPCGFKCRTLFS